ncbi:uncharacterized protein LOC110443288 [Mizuhopecten yessoensis]|nr:uncharacterized protein LOC110443288 [Mizuhopecten yessoensis]
MAILRRHKVLLGLSVIGVILLIGAFTSPGWFRIRYVSTGPGDGWENHLSGKGPIAMTKRESDPERRRQHQRDSEVPPLEDKFVYISAGLWYFMTCVEYVGDDWNTIEKCHYSTYCHASHAADHLPEVMRGVGLESVYMNIGEMARFGLLEFQVEGAIGMFCAIVGMIAGFWYVRGHFTKRGAGLTTFIFHIIAGVLFAVIFGKVITMYKMAIMTVTQFYDYDTDFIYLYMAIPYPLLIVSLGSVIILGVSLVFLIILSKGPRKHIDLIKATGKGPGVPFGMISPPGYQPFPGHADLPPTKENGPLPEKEPL